MSVRACIGRICAVVLKETRQLLRDRLSFTMMFTIPVLELVLFGFAINADPKNLPAAVIAADSSHVTRAIVSALAATGYFRFDREVSTDAEAETLLQRGEVQFVVSIPSDFTRRIVRGERAQLVITADATDPSATGQALAAVDRALASALGRELVGPLSYLRVRDGPIEAVVQRRYNPEGLTHINVVPGLLGTILTVTMVMMTALAVTRERERGTMANLLAMPLTPAEVMAGKILPYVLIGLAQFALILIAARLLFAVPMIGGFALLAAATTLFITVNLAIGFTFSTVAENQLQAMQMSFFFLLPSMLLSGFAFPFRGMPGWAQAVGECLPLTHFLRIVRGVMLKGAIAGDVAAGIAALVLLLLLVSTVAISRYRVTLD